MAARCRCLGASARGAVAVVSASIACRSSRSSPAGAAHGQVQVVQSVLSAAPRTRARLGSRLTHTGARSADTLQARARAPHWHGSSHTGSSHTRAAATHWQQPHSRRAPVKQPHTGAAAATHWQQPHTGSSHTPGARAPVKQAGARRARARARPFVHRVEAEQISPAHPLISVAWGAMTVRTRQPSPSAAFTRRAP